MMSKVKHVAIILLLLVTSFFLIITFYSDFYPTIPRGINDNGPVGQHLLLIALFISTKIIQLLSEWRKWIVFFVIGIDFLILLRILFVCSMLYYNLAIIFKSICFNMYTP